MKKEIKTDTRQNIAVLSDDGNGRTIEANVTAFGDGEPKIDIRSWVTIDGTKVPYKGVRLTDDEAVKLCLSLARYLKISESDLILNERK